MKLLKSWHWYR